VRDDGHGKLRIKLMLLERSANRYIWADYSECAVGIVSGSKDWLTSLAVGALRCVLRNAEIIRATGTEFTQPTAWDLSMRALPIVLAADPSAHGTAIELLGRAMEFAPHDPVPVSLAAWCYGMRAGHHFTNHPQIDREDALRLASDASYLSAGNPLAETMLSAAYMLAHDLVAAENHARRALAIDGGSAWGWGRLAWVHAYRGEATKAIECCHIAHALAPADPLGYLWSIGIAASHFELGHFDRAVDWYRRALAGQPKATWINRFLAPASALANKIDDAQQSIGALRSAFPDLTIAQIRTGLPHTTLLLDRVAEGLAGLGMPFG